MWPYWSCDLEGLYKFLFPQPKEALKEIWLHLAQWVIGEVFSFSSMGGHLVYPSRIFLAILVGSHLGNIPMKFESHWPMGSGGVSF